MCSTRILKASSPCKSGNGATRIVPLLPLVAVIAITACGRSPAAPSSPYAGRWSGVIDDSVAGRGTLEITLTDTANLEGRWSASVSATTLSGSIALVAAPPGTAERQFALSCGGPPAGGSIVFMTPLDTVTLQGRYLAFGCGRLSEGTARLTHR